MAFENVIYQKEKGIARITINRPQAMNALNPATLQEIEAAVRQAGPASSAWSASFPLTPDADSKMQELQRSVPSVHAFVPELRGSKRVKLFLFLSFSVFHQLVQL